ncbi:MAG: hypothetical protein EOP07_05455 [Proteobacteria bacterium]|nr:MAG: hypothetical protein EOP07_05455 [Pseudomonadota bacterium]
MNIIYLLIAVLVLNTSCLKYKKLYKPPVTDSGDASAEEESSGDEESTGDEESSEEESSGDEESSEEDTALTGSLMNTLAATANSKELEVKVNLNGKHSVTKKVQVSKNEILITISDLPALKSGQMKLELIDGKELRLSTRLSNVTTVASKDLKVVLNRCKAKASNKIEKEVSCNWSAEQAMQ